MVLSNKESKKIAESLNLSKKIGYYASCPSFITIKDHKPNLPKQHQIQTNESCNNRIRTFGKKQLEKIIANVANTIRVKQWRIVSLS